MSQKKIFITGIAGFIGFHTALFLHSRGDLVSGLDNFNAYYDPALKRQRASLLKQAGIDYFEGDICHVEELKVAIEKQNPTHILHLAAQAGVRYSLENPKAYIQSNIDGFLNILEVCRSLKQIKLVYASSSSVYGLNEKSPFSIEDRTDRQASLYGVTKKTNELMAETYCHLFGIQATGLRFFTVYGPFGRPDMAYFSFARNILEGRPIQCYNYGKMERDFTYISDIVEGIAAAIDKENPKPLYNLGNHNPEPLSHLIACLEKSLKKKAIIEYLPHQMGDVFSTYADIKLSQDDLGFFPKVSLQEGIEKFATWFMHSKR